MTIVFRSKKLLEVVNGTILKPTDAVKLKEWEDKDASAQELLVTRIDEGILTHLLACQSSAAMWEKLNTIYEPKSKVSIHLLQQKFFNLKFEEPMSAYISQIEDIVNQLKSMDEILSETMVVTKLLMSLPAKYKHFVSAWESVPTKDQKLNELISRLLVEEESTGSQTETTSYDIAFVSQHKNKYQGRFNRQKQHNKQEQKRLCHFCKKPGHFIKDCRNRIQKEKEQNPTAFIGSALFSGFNLQQKTWYLDSGASHHMSCNKDWIDNYELVDMMITIGDGREIKAVGRGSVSISAYNGTSWVRGATCSRAKDQPIFSWQGVNKRLQNRRTVRYL